MRRRGAAYQGCCEDDHGGSLVGLFRLGRTHRGEGRGLTTCVPATPGWIEPHPLLEKLSRKAALSFEMTARDLTDQMHAHCVPCRCARVQLVACRMQKVALRGRSSM